MQFRTFVSLCACVCAAVLTCNIGLAQQYSWEAKVRQAIEQSRFADANAALDEIEATGEEQTQIDWYRELMRRIRLEFPYDEEQITAELKEAGVDPTEKKMREWEAKKFLEMRPFDGRRFYFKYAVSNLFRIDPSLRNMSGDLVSDRSKYESRIKNGDSMIQASDGKGKLTHGRKNVFHCVATLPANTVPAGETIKYWAPFPRESTCRQQDVKLLSHNADVCEISPKEDMQRIVYMEKKTVKDEPTVFDFSFQTTSYAQYFSQDYLLQNVRPYDVNSDLYKEYTTEYLPHMIKSDSMKKWADDIVGDETNPVKVVSLLFDAIDERFPWASSNEYGTMLCIPEYVIREGHGDCGMLTLTLISALRCEGIPAKWQSGWIMRNDGSCSMHDWGEIFYEGVGWVPVDVSYGLMPSDVDVVRDIYKSSLDQFRLVINDNIGCKFTPEKVFFRSEPVDCQKGEMEWREGNLYFNLWYFKMTVQAEELD